MSFIAFLESVCSGDDAHDGKGDSRPLLERCGMCAEIYKAHQAGVSEALNTAETQHFMKGLAIEIAHQREVWKATDPHRSDADWYWLIGWLGGKALTDPHEEGDARTPLEQKLHRIITVAAAAAHWYRSAKEDKVGDRVIAYDPRVYFAAGGKDIGENEHCWLPAVVTKVYQASGLDGYGLILDLLFDHDPRESRGHFGDGANCAIRGLAGIAKSLEGKET